MFDIYIYVCVNVMYVWEIKSADFYISTAVLWKKPGFPSIANAHIYSRYNMYVEITLGWAGHPHFEDLHDFRRL